MENENNKFDVNLDPNQCERLRVLFGFKKNFKLPEDEETETKISLKNKIKKFFGKSFF